MIIDTCFYNGEENILEVRLETLNDIVDKFILLESPRSHSQIPRELEFPKQKDRFLKFRDKIFYHTYDYCDNSNHLLNDWTGRKLMHGLLLSHGLKNDDLVLNGDLDEIPRLESLLPIINGDMKRPSTLMMENRVLCFDLQCDHVEGKFPGTMVLKGQHIIDSNLCDLRQIRGNPTIGDRKYKLFNLIENGGFHLGYCAGIDRTIDKFRFYSHSAETSNWLKTKSQLINCIKTKTGFTPEARELKLVEWKRENFPAQIFNNPDRYKENLSFYYE